MAQIRPQLIRDPAFERFLGAAVGDDGHGTPVSVLSMLARLDVDPWDEAASLATMNNDPAVKRLEALMVRFQDVTLAAPDRSKIARTLLAALPHREKAKAAAVSSEQAQFAALPAGAPVFWFISVALIVGWVLMLVRGG
jgi:hypothetical protein